MTPMLSRPFLSVGGTQELFPAGTPRPTSTVSESFLECRIQLLLPRRRYSLAISQSLLQIRRLHILFQIQEAQQCAYFSCQLTLLMCSRGIKDPKPDVNEYGAPARAARRKPEAAPCESTICTGKQREWTAWVLTQLIPDAEIPGRATISRKSFVAIC
jgi:hypothetical protein